MQHFQAHSTDDLRQLIAEYGHNALFRGQTTHYGQPVTLCCGIFRSSNMSS